MLGPSGSGKSTLLNLVSGIDLPDAGRVRVGGVDLTALDEQARTRFRRERVGFVFQFFNLIPTLTVLENLLLPLELNGTEGPPARARAEALLRAVGLEDRADAAPDRLSGGEQQRVAVARALANRPLLLLADEPSGNLDPSTTEHLHDLLFEVSAAHGSAMIVVTHDMGLAGRAGRVLELRGGQLVPAVHRLAP